MTLPTLGCILLVALLTLLIWGLGRGLVQLAGDGAPSPVTAFLAGWVTIHILLTSLQAVGIAWTRGSLLASLIVLAGSIYGASYRLCSSDPNPEDLPRPLGWGDAVAGLALAGFAVTAVTLRSVHPDFIFHWGIKAKKFVLAGGVDFQYLARPWNHYTHPDYPTLLSEIYAITTLLAGRFSEPALLLWAVPFFAGLLWISREWLALRCPSPGVRQAGLATLALGIAAFAVGYLQAGGADLLMALAVVAGAAALDRGRTDARTDLALGTAAAFAAASKIEGVVLAGILLSLGILRPMLRRELTVGTTIRRVLPTLLVVVPWFLRNRQHGLFQETNLGSFAPNRLGAIGEALLESMAIPPWHGLPFLLVALPALLLLRRPRWIAAVALLQLGFYLFVYVTTPVDPVFYVRSSFPRLLLHLVPIAMLGLVSVVGATVRTR